MKTNNPLTMTHRNRKFLIFSLHDSLLALDLAQVAEVCDPPELSPIPLAPACYCGALSFHGDIVAVMDLALFLDLTACSQPNKLIVLNQKLASLAFLVDTVVQIVSEEDVTVIPSVDKRFTATLALAEGSAKQLDLETLIQSAETDMHKKQ